MSTRLWNVGARRAFDGRVVVPDAVVMIHGERILRVCRRDELPPGTHVDLELGNATLLPGLIDAHVHLSGRRSYDIGDRIQTSRDLRVLRAAEDCRALLRSGYTTVRDVGSEIALSLARAVRAGLLSGPAIYCAGPMIGQTGGHTDHPYLSHSQAVEVEGALLADGVEGCRLAVRRAVRSGSDLIKICTTGGIGSEGDHPHDSHYTLEEVVAIVDEAHRLGRRVACHAQGTLGILTAIKAGVDSIEHATYLDDECIALLADSPIFVVPTVALRSVFIGAQDSAIKLPPWRQLKQAEAIDAIARGFHRILDAGVEFACGSDFTGVPGREHGTNALEPIYMVELGASPLQALAAATHAAAEVLGLADEIGSLMPGMRADLVAVDGDATMDIEALRRVRLVVQAGCIRVEPYSRPVGATTYVTPGASAMDLCPTSTESADRLA